MANVEARKKCVKENTIESCKLLVVVSVLNWKKSLHIGCVNLRCFFKSRELFPSFAFYAN